MRASIIALGFLAALVPAIAAAQGTPPPAPAADPNAATAPPPTYAPPPGQQPAYAPPPAQPAYAPPPPMAVAEAAPTSSPKGLSVWGILGGYGNAFGAGGRFMLPLGIQPLLHSSGVRDNFALEFGADFTHWGYSYGTYSWSYNQVVPVVGIMWNIWLSPQFALYPKVDLGYALGWWTGWDTTYGTQADHGWLFWDVAGGLLYKMQSGLTLRAEVGYTGLKAGVGWLF